MTRARTLGAIFTLAIGAGLPATAWAGDVCEEWVRSAPAERAALVASVQARAPESVKACIAEPRHTEELAAVIESACEAIITTVHRDLQVGVSLGIVLRKQLADCLARRSQSSP
jgi:hypothetical protein